METLPIEVKNMIYSYYGPHPIIQSPKRTIHNVRKVALHSIYGKYGTLKCFDMLGADAWKYSNIKEKETAGFDELDDDVKWNLFFEYAQDYVEQNFNNDYTRLHFEFEKADFDEDVYEILELEKSEFKHLLKCINNLSDTYIKHR